MQRMPFSQRLGGGVGSPRAQGRCDRQEPPADGLVRADSDRARPIPSALASLAAKSELRATSKYIARRLAEDITDAPGSGRHDLIAAAATRSEDYQSDIVDGLTLGLQGQQGVAKPAGVGCVREDASASSPMPDWPRRCARSMRRSAAPRRSTEARKVALDGAATARGAQGRAAVAPRRARAGPASDRASRCCRSGRSTASPPRRSRPFNDPAIAPLLIDAYPQFDAADRPRAHGGAQRRVRPTPRALLDAVAAGRVPRVRDRPPSTRSRSAASTTPRSPAGSAKSGARSATRPKPRSSSWRHTRPS